MFCLHFGELFLLLELFRGVFATVGEVLNAARIKLIYWLKMRKVANESLYLLLLKCFLRLFEHLFPL